MGRPKKNRSQILVGLVAEFYEREANGDCSRLRFTALSDYAKSRGYEAEAYDFRRDAAVRGKIEEIRAGQEEQANEAMAVAYRNIDVEALLRRCSDLESLKRSIRGLDDYWRGVYEQILALKRENERLRNASNRLQDTRELQEALKELQRELNEAKSSNRRLLDENACLRRVLRTSLYPAVAEELLRQEHLPMPENETVKPEAFGTLIEGKPPAAFKGEQGEKEPDELRRERLLERLKAGIEKK
jgi:hypothetical protein